MRSVIALSAAAFAGLSAAQATSQYNYPYTIDPNSVSQANRDYWCQQNQAQCPLICLQQPGVTSMTTETNDCDSDTLTYSCVCENGIVPNITQYSQTLPFFICQQWGNNCVDNCGGDNTCADSCRADHPCGAQSPYLGNATSSSLLATASATASSSTRPPTTGFGGQTSTPSPAGSAASSTYLPSAGLGLAAVVGSAFFGFALLL
ncbi:hypothetical protein ACN47E_000789 [Coniothyrium glycines]